jgi:hypothetical protein
VAINSAQRVVKQNVLGTLVYCTRKADSSLRMVRMQGHLNPVTTDLLTSGKGDTAN